MNNVDINKLSIISDGSFLLTAGTLEDYNTMTVGWGQIGVLWAVPVLSVYVRYNRYTYEFMEKNDIFTASFFDNAKYSKMLGFCGTKSGRDFDKAKETGITPISVDDTVSFAEASKIIVCKKIYTEEINGEKFLDKQKFTAYYSEDNPLHKVYIGQIISAYERV
ncbi:MAG: flavin reductase family protein [Oscillospiraceae bacterium]|jgi:flavin reductase (DIM6/NTAB) family NADH-FMN oxidoreductase RutF|nr:flavin reductase family protein [Oscillospiraceae bacterium]